MLAPSRGKRCIVVGEPLCSSYNRFIHCDSSTALLVPLRLPSLCLTALSPRLRVPLRRARSHRCNLMIHLCRCTALPPSSNPCYPSLLAFSLWCSPVVRVPLQRCLDLNARSRRRCQQNKVTERSTSGLNSQHLHSASTRALSRRVVAAAATGASMLSVDVALHVSSYSVSLSLCLSPSPSACAGWRLMRKGRTTSRFPLAMLCSPACRTTSLACLVCHPPFVRRPDTHCTPVCPRL